MIRVHHTMLRECSKLRTSCRIRSALRTEANMTGMTVMALRSCSLEELKKEPWRLQIQADTTAEQLRGLVLRNYHVFIQSNQSATVVKEELQELKDQTTEILTAIPELKQFCSEVQEETAGIVAKHGDIQFIFDHYLELTELLEIPQLLEACIHNEQFDSALDVIQFAKETFQNDLNPSEKGASGGTNFVIQALVREVEQMTTLLRESLLQKLREDLQLALCVRIVGYLRRLDALVHAFAGENGTSIHAVALVGTPEYERQLKEAFLRCRSSWLGSLARTLSTTDAYQFTIQLIDIKRTSWFDMITQYSAIFGSENVDGKVDPPLCRWATTTVADFIQVLMSQLPRIDDFSSLATVLEQSLFFGGSLGRVGVDFRAVLVVYFEDHVHDLMTQTWSGACRDFQESLSAHSLTSSSSTVPASSRTPIVLASYRHSLTSTTSPSPFASSGDDDFSPPRVLMSFPLLAEFTNALLTSFNDLRLCTIVSLQNRLAKRLQHTLAAMLLVVKDFIGENQLKLQPRRPDTDTPQETSKQHKARVLADSIRDMNEVIASELLPYITRCFQRLFPPTKPSSKSASAADIIDVAALTRQMEELQLLVSAA